MARIKHGDFIEIPLEGEFGFGYAKFIDPKKISVDKDLLPIFHLYNYTSLKSLKDYKEIKKELLIAPVTVAGTNGINKLGWRIIGNEPVLDDEKFLPDVKTSWPPVGPSTKWAYYENLGDTTKMHFARLEQVEHLAWAESLEIDIVAFRITLELLKIMGKDIKNEIGLKDWLEEYEYKNAIGLPIYSELPDAKKGRALRNLG